ncbi:MAG: type IV secretory system conjugative DNA transfer family protein [Bacteroidales bacterium]
MTAYFSSNSHTENSAKFLSGWKKFLYMNPFKKGLVIGKDRISEKISLQHALILGGSGYGKTTAYIIPCLMKIRNASIYVLDPSQELYNLTSNHLSRFFDIYSINLGDPARSHYWNPLVKARTKDDLKMIADAIISSAFPNESGDAKFWNDGARSILNILLNSVHKQNDKKTLNYVYNMLNRFNASDMKELNEYLSTNLDNDNWLELKGLLAQPEKVWGSQVATAKVALSPISSETLKTLSQKSTIDFASFREKPSLLFVIVPEHRIKENMVYLSLLFREIFETLLEMPAKKDLVQYLLLDEAGNIFIPKLSNYITVLRKRRTSVSLICQSTRQLFSLYGNDAHTIIENTLNHLYFPGLSLESCQQLSQKIGSTFIEPQNTYFPTNKKEWKKTALISPESVRTLKNGRALFLSGNMPGVIVRLQPWFRNPWMKIKLRKRRR